jgi:hypothetical protein
VNILVVGSYDLCSSLVVRDVSLLKTLTGKTVPNISEVASTPLNKTLIKIPTNKLHHTELHSTDESVWSAQLGS